uniref:Uncharacterized protein n=1 Tax=Helianthus annuus TaxID=4232 RepID=A0A251SFF2_HELAN
MNSKTQRRLLKERERERATEDRERRGGDGGTGYGLRPTVLLSLNGNFTAGVLGFRRSGHYHS